MNKYTSLRTLAYYLSQYLWLLYFIIPIVCSMIFPKISSRKTVYSSNIKFNNSENPTIFAHVTDSHLNTIIPEHTAIFRQMVEYIRECAPDFIIHTGDMVDNYDSLTVLRYGNQDEENWKIYEREISPIANIPTIDMVGNHDMFGVKSVTSNRNYFLDYSRIFTRQNTRSEDDFTLRTFRISDFNIIVINPFKFPTAHPPLHLYARYSKRLLDKIEKEISANSSRKNIIAGHYPVGSIHSKKSSSGKRSTDIIGSSDSVLVYLSGHSHPKEAEVFHHGNGGVEILGPASFFDSKFGIVTVDNNGVAWSMIDKTNPPKAVLSYPIPSNQLSKNAIFNDKTNADIRLIMFSNRTNHSISFSIFESKKKKIFSGRLNFSRTLPKGQSLYSFPIKDCIQKDGKYTITFSGDFDGSTEFLIGEKMKSSTAIFTEFPKLIESLTITFPIFLGVLFVITVIIPFDCGNWQEKLDSIENWVETGEGLETYWIVVIFFGFILIRARVQRLPLLIKIFMLIAVLYGICGPLLFFVTENMVGFVWTFGYDIDNRAIPADYGIFYAFLYAGSVCFPSIILYSSFAVRKWSIKQLGDVIFFFAGLAVNILVLLRLVHETVGGRLTCSSIGFFIIPILLIVLMCVYLFYLRGLDKNHIEKKKKEKNLELRAHMSNFESKYSKSMSSVSGNESLTKSGKFIKLDHSDEIEESVKNIELNPL